MLIELFGDLFDIDEINYFVIKSKKEHDKIDDNQKYLYKIEIWMKNSTTGWLYTVVRTEKEIDEIKKKMLEMSNKKGAKE